MGYRGENRCPKGSSVRTVREDAGRVYPLGQFVYSPLKMSAISPVLMTSGAASSAVVVTDTSQVQKAAVRLCFSRDRNTSLTTETEICLNPYTGTTTSANDPRKQGPGRQDMKIRQGSDAEPGKHCDYNIYIVSMAFRQISCRPSTAMRHWQLHALGRSHSVSPSGSALQPSKKKASCSITHP